ncbi:MAG: heavy metal-binding domain-containing protein [Acidimicrobiales bacterium]
MTPGDLPEAAERRLKEGAFSSGLSVNDFAACLTMGLEPVGLVQGFCAMQSSNFGRGLMQRGLSPYGGSQSGYVQNYQCPHGFISNEHRAWGQNYEETWVENGWNEGFRSAYSRMLEEAQEIGAHGIVGVVDTESALSESGIIEFLLRGTAVKLENAPAPTTVPWTTYLAGQRLAKIFEAGYAPVSVVAAISSMRVWAYCITEYLMGGSGGMWGNPNSSEVDQLVRAKTYVRSTALSTARNELHNDALHGAELVLREREFEHGDYEVQALLRGNRIRRFKDFEAIAVPQPTVRLS